MLVTAGTIQEWQDAASRAFVPLRCTSLETTFRARLRELRLGERASITEVWSSAALVERTPRMAATSADACVHLSVQMASHGRIEQHGRVVPVRPGSVTLYATHEPYRLDYSGAGQHLIVVQLPIAALGLPRTVIDTARDRLSIPDLPARRVFADLVASTSRSQPPGNDTWLEHVIVDLASVLLRSADAPARVVPDTPEALTALAQRILRDRAGDPDLAVEDVAHALFISRRKLYDLFAETGTTPATYLREERLRRAASFLRSGGPGSSEASIASIAHTCGFSDVTTFIRAFRRRYGTSPGRWREQTQPLS